MHSLLLRLVKIKFVPLYPEQNIRYLVQSFQDCIRFQDIDVFCGMILRHESVMRKVFIFLYLHCSAAYLVQYSYGPVNVLPTSFTSEVNIHFGNEILLAK